MSNVNVYTGKKLENNRPHITFLLEKEKQKVFIDTAVTADQIIKTQNEKIMKRYQRTDI